MKISRATTDALKGFSILTIVIAHACGMARAFIGIPLLQDAQFCSMLCQAGMCLFLLLSGYGMYHSFIKNGLERYWDKRIRKVFLPAFIIQFVWFIIRNGIDYNKEIPFASITVVGENNAVDSTMWYLSFALFCYVAFFLCFYYFPNKVAIGLLTLIFVFGTPTMISTWKWNYYCTFSFCFGVLISCVSQLIEKMPKAWFGVIFACCLPVIIVYYKYAFRQNYLFDNIASNLSAIAIMIFFIFLEKKCSFRLLKLLGKHSFLIYLLEYKIIFAWIDYLKWSNIRKLLTFLGLFIITILFAVIIDKSIEKIAKTRNTNKI